MYVWAAAVALVSIGAALTALRRRHLSELPLVHVAAAAIVGMFGWEMLIQLPGTVMGFWSLTAGITDPSGVTGRQLHVIGQAIFVVNAALAIVGIVRRALWGVVLGIGSSAAMVLWNALLLYETMRLNAESVGAGDYFGAVLPVTALQMVPALVAIGLLVSPLRRHALAAYA